MRLLNRLPIFMFRVFRRNIFTRLPVYTSEIMRDRRIGSGSVLKESYIGRVEFRRILVLTHLLA